MIGQKIQQDIPDSPAHAPGMGGAIWGDTTLPWRGPFKGKKQWPIGNDIIFQSSNKASEHNVGLLPPIIVQWQPPAQMQSGQTAKITSRPIVNVPRIIVGIKGMNPLGR